MRRRCSQCATILVVGAALLGTIGQAAGAETPETLLEEGTKLAKSCYEPKADWPKKKLSSNFDYCNDSLQALVKAIELSNKNVKTVEAALPSLTTVNFNMASTAVRIARIYTEGESREAALGFFRVACTASEAVSAFDKPTPEQAAAMKAVVAEAEQGLQGFHRSCKSVVAAPD